MNVKRLVVISLVLTFVMGFFVAQPAQAAVLQFGPYSGVTPDSGTCGNNWATDFITRTLVVDTADVNHPTIKWAGSFTSIAGPSPNACNAGPNNGNVILAGVTGTLVGDYDVQITSGTFNPAATCTASSCNTTAGLIKTFYGATATYNVAPGGFYFRYDVCDGRWWQNASANRGGNQGDISGGLPLKTGACAPAAQFFNPNDGRVDPRPGDRLVVYCNVNDTPPSVVVYGTRDDVPDYQKGFWMATFAYSDLLAAGQAGITKSAGKNGTVSMMVDNGRYFYVAWNGGIWKATGQDDFAKSFTCNFAQ